ncbi:hypothetical protein LWI28_029017 [Acer negundo]|uniref:Uncharacterized protein n=1 Tax=Acer negundo TaxID=4023 RepID=A0AAD5IWQ5_ACENE|nr:hypothetical protein LWI28_029017 [Acer negundo]KAK4845774.1 hypothetical protein QYF36_008926 [Acer negundo]
MDNEDGKAAAIMVAREEIIGKTEIPQKTLDDLVKVLERMNNGSGSGSGAKAGAVEDNVEIHQKALDDLVNVNSLFTISVFIGLSFATPNQLHSLDSRPECDPDSDMAKMLVVYEVISFACFLLSSLVAKSLKVVLNIRKKEQIDKDHLMIPDRLFKRWLLSEKWRTFLMVVTIAASISGIWFLTFSMVNVIQIRVGKLSCRSNYALSAVIPLFVVVLASQVIYAPSMMYGVFVTASAGVKGSDHDKTQA